MIIKPVPNGSRAPFMPLRSSVPKPGGSALSCDWGWRDLRRPSDSSPSRSRPS
ncbi:Uncharacterised protein [Bordetella pertussis]|nr:Uncharacterised protein [Bordetella pertussis]